MTYNVFGGTLNLALSISLIIAELPFGPQLPHKLTPSMKLVL